MVSWSLGWRRHDRCDRAVLFRVRYRCSGSSFAYSAAGILGGGVGPLIATDLLARTGSTTGVSWYLIGVAALRLVCLLSLRETRHPDFTV